MGLTGTAAKSRRWPLYGAFSLVTTLIFWGFEVAFWTIWKTDAAKYTGAVIGLAIGYAAKFTRPSFRVPKSEGMSELVVLLMRSQV
jgi:hypothetical protein